MLRPCRGVTLNGFMHNILAHPFPPSPTRHYLPWRSTLWTRRPVYGWWCFFLGQCKFQFSSLHRISQLSIQSLYGVGLLQCWLYFRWYPRDSLRVKSAVCTLLLPNILHTPWQSVSTGPSPPVRSITTCGKRYSKVIYIYQILWNLTNLNVSRHNIYSLDKSLWGFSCCNVNHLVRPIVCGHIF